MRNVVLTLGLLALALPVFGKTASFADFDARATAGERLTVVYFGGSLTWSANASEPDAQSDAEETSDETEDEQND